MRSALLITLFGAISMVHGGVIPRGEQGLASAETNKLAHTSGKYKHVSPSGNYSYEWYDYNGDGQYYGNQGQRGHHGQNQGKHHGQKQGKGKQHGKQHGGKTSGNKGNKGGKTSGSAPSGKGASVDQAHILQLHNTRRAEHHAPALTWNQEAADFAQSWVNRCVFQHSQDHRFGENIAMGYQSWDQVMKGWADDEEKLYNFQSGDFSMQTGHFTQVVWKGTSSVGCAVAQCSNGPFYSCNYVKPGNVMGQFQQNVLPK